MIITPKHQLTVSFNTNKICLKPSVRLILEYKLEDGHQDVIVFFVHYFQHFHHIQDICS